MYKFLLALVLLVFSVGFAHAQSGCTVQTQAQNLAALADGGVPGNITPQKYRNLACQDQSVNNVTASGGTTARTLAARAADTMNVLDGFGAGPGAKCDGVTDDTTSIQNTINYAAGKARVYVPNTGTACLVTRLTVPSNTHITVDGTLKLKSGANAGGTVLAADTSSPSNIVIDGSGIIDGNQSGQASGVQADIYLFGASNVWISGVTTQNSRNFPINVVASSNVFISRIKSLNNVGSVEFAQGAHDCWIDLSDISASSADYGFAFYGGVYNSGITNSRVYNNAADGIVVLNDGAQTAGSHDLVISNNVAYGNAGSGISTHTNAGATASNNNIIISGNRLYGNNIGGNSGWGGVYLVNSNYVTITGNIISGDGSGGAVSSVGITTTAGAYYTTITGNTIFDEGVGSTLGVGIVLGGPYVTATGNVIFDDQGTQSMAFGITGGSGVGTVISKNVIGALLGAGYNASIPNQDALSITPQGRLTLTSGAAVMTTDAVAQTTVYYDCYNGPSVPINGLAFPITSCEVSMGLSASNHLSGNVYDIFAVNNSGAMALCTGPAWSSTTARGTGAGTTQIGNTTGAWVNSQTLTHCYGGGAGTTDYGSVPVAAATYLGSFYATANGQTTEQFAPAAATGGNATMLGLFNAYNRVGITAQSADSTSSWTYALTTWRAEDASNSNRITWLDGLAQVPVVATSQAYVSGGAAVNGVTFNSITNAPLVSLQSSSAGAGNTLTTQASTPPVLGLSYAQAMESAAGSTTWAGAASGPTRQLNGLSIALNH